MTKINFKSNKSKTFASVVTSMILGLMLISPTVLVSNVNAATDMATPPREVTAWMNSHPNFAGCVSTDLKTNISTEISCFPSNAKPSVPIAPLQSKVTPAFSSSVTNLDCSSTCWSGGQFNDNGPYKQIVGNTVIGSKPTNMPVAFFNWAGLTNCYWNHCPTSNILVQSGWTYQSSASATLPGVFTEIYGPFMFQGHNCLTYCGTLTLKAANHQVYTSNYALNNAWTAYVQDSSDGTSYFTTIPFSTTGVSNSVPYAMTSLEAQNAINTSWFSASPVSFTSIALYAPGVGQVPTNTGLMAAFVGPLTGSIHVTYTASGTPTATATNTY